MEKGSNEIALMLEVGYVLRYAGRYSEAREVFHATRALLPQNEISDLALAGVFLDEEKYEEATTHCQRALSLNPTSAPAHTQLAELHLLRHEYAKAKQNLQRAMELAPKGPTAELTKMLTKVLSIVESNGRPARAIST